MRRLCLIISLLLCINVVSAQDFSVKFPSGRTLYFTITSSKTCTVMVPGFDRYQFTGSLVIPETVTDRGNTYTITGIEDGTFANSRITSVTIPESVTCIGSMAFYGCRYLTTIILPESITRIGGESFASSGLSSIKLPDGLVEIGNRAFEDCPLQEIIVPNSVTKISIGAFSFCKDLASVKLSDSISYLPDALFLECKSLTNIEIPEGVTSISSTCFEDCVRLNKVKLPKSLIRIVGEVDEVFPGCVSLDTIIIPVGTREQFEELLPEWKDKLVEQ